MGRRKHRTLSLRGLSAYSLFWGQFKRLVCLPTNKFAHEAFSPIDAVPTFYRPMNFPSSPRFLPFAFSPSSRADLTQAEQEALAFVYDLRNRFESGDIPLEEEEGGNFFGIFKKAFNQ